MQNLLSQTKFLKNLENHLARIHSSKEQDFLDILYYQKVSYKFFTIVFPRSVARFLTTRYTKMNKTS